MSCVRMLLLARVRARPPGTCRGSVRVLLMTGIVVALGACAGAQEPPPEGFARFEGPGYRFVYPAEWELREGEDVADPARDVEVRGPAGTGDLRPGIVGSHSEGFPPDLTIDHYVTQFHTLGTMRLPDREVVDEQEIDVPGATAARLVETRYVLPLEGDDVSMRQLDVLALGRGGVTVNVRASGPSDDFDEALMGTVVESVRVGR